MIFNSFSYIIFLAVVVLAIGILNQKSRWLVLLATSFVFYASWSIKYCFLILLSSLIAYGTAIGLSKSPTQRIKKLYLAFCVLSHVGILFLFKYFNFFNQSLKTLLEYFQISVSLPDFQLLLPIGISYYTFQGISYITDVYKGKILPEKHFGLFTLYMVFFPKLVAGPIERADRLIPQLKNAQFSLLEAISGVKLFGWGLFKKVVIADRLAILVDTVYNNPQGYGGIPLIAATVFFAFQIYCDFSAYTDMALGSARLLGIRLTQNFQRPYYAKSIKEFWSRWHISLSTWLRDYIYIPLGGSRVQLSRYYLNILLTFLVSGLWHGANWTFVLWGALHGFYQIFGHITKGLRQRLAEISGLTKLPKLHKLVQVGITFALVCFAWIFFRANSIGDGLYIVRHLVSGLTRVTDLSYVYNQLVGLGLNIMELIAVLVAILIMEVVHFYQRNEQWQQRFAKMPLPLRWSFYYLVIFMIIILGVYDSETQFIYVQF